jgi:membrane protein DedA with SNARE-associated domain
MTADIAPDPATLDPAQRALARRSLSALGALSVGSMIGVASSLYLVNHYPLLLIALSPLGRHLVLVAPIVDPVAFVVVALTRRMAFYVSCFLLGRSMGPSGVVWLEERAARFARFVRWLEALFARWSKTVTFVTTGPTISALAGMSGMPMGLFVVLAGLGLLLRVIGILLFAEALREPIEWLLAWIDVYWRPGTALLVAGTLLYQWRRIRVQRAAQRSTAQST